MEDPILEFRRWLQDPTPEEARRLAEVTVLRQQAHLAQSTSARRAAAGIRAWAARASSRDLRALAEYGVGLAGATLEREGWSAEAVADPDRDQLTGMLVSLDPGLAVLAVFGLVIGTFPASPLVLSATAEFLAAARSPRRLREGLAVADRPDDAPAAGRSDVDEDELLAEELLADARRAGATLSEAAMNGLDFADAMAAFEEARELLREHLASIGIAWNAADGFDQATTRLAEWAEQRRAQRLQNALRDAEIAALRDRRKQLGEALASDVTPEVRVAFEREIARIDAELVEPVASRFADETVAASGPDPHSKGAALMSVAQNNGGEATPTVADDTTTPNPEPSSTTGPAEVAEAPATPERHQEEAAGERTSVAQTAEVPADRPARLPTEEVLDSEPLEKALSGFIAAGRFDEARYLTVATAGFGPREEALGYAAAAFRCRTKDQAEAVAVAFDGRTQPERFRADPVAEALVVVGALRLARDTAWPPASLGGRIGGSASVAEPDDGAGWWRLADAAADVVRHAGHLPAGEPGIDDGAQRRSLLGRQAEALLEQLPKRTVNYERATNVLRRLARGVVGSALAAVVDWADGRIDRTELRQRVASWQGSDVDAHIDQATQELSVIDKNPIEARARKRLRQHLLEVKTVIGTALALSEVSVPGSDYESENGLRRVLATLSGRTPPPGAAYAALGLLRDWLSAGVSPVGEEVSVDDPLRPDPTPLLAAPALWQHGEGPRLDNASSIIALTCVYDLDGLLAEYEQRGDIGLARRLMAAALQGRTPAVRIPDRPQAEALQRRIAASEQDWDARRKEEYRSVFDLSARLLAMNLSGADAYETGSGAAVDGIDARGRLQALSEAPTDGAYGRTLAALADLEDGLRAELAQITNGMKRELNARTSLSVADKSRISAILADGDIVAARELLTIAEQEGVLPAPTRPSGQDLKEFTDLLAQAESLSDAEHAAIGPTWFAERAAGRGRLDPTVLDALESWQQLSSPAGFGKWQRNLPSILRTLGLDCRSADLIDSGDKGRTPVGIRRLRAKLHPPRDGYIAAFGSHAPTTFTVFVVTNQVAAANPLKIINDWPEPGPVIVLSMRPIWAEGRRALLAATRRQPAEVLVVDSAVYGWIAGRAPQSFRALQRVTLPWTGLTPYTPFAAGRVPPEVFHGRTKEMRQIVSPVGPMFIYGGRQLGKSAMLRRAAGDFADGPGRVAVYLDLKANGIGEEELPGRLWRVLADRLREHGVISDRIGENADPEVVVKAIRRWIQADPDRRVLLLADEADAFLTKDHRDTVPFRTFTTVLDLINETNGRFKAVFAGLHQVQRFVKVPNASLVHGGEPICVGPLDPVSARQLIVEPLAAVGYVFGADADRLVWRIIAHTNGQASLVQIFCDALVRLLAEREGPTVPSVIDESAVDLAARQVRPKLVDRLRFTINLQDRYRVLMLILAIKSIEDGYALAYKTADLLEDARLWWREGFSTSTVEEVDITLSEMVGLGVVVRRGDRYAVRSPNLVAMLGTREALEDELSSESFDSPYEYDPDLARRTLLHRGTLRQVSPLTERQLREALSPGLRQIAASLGLGRERIPIALQSYAKTSGIAVECLDAERFSKKLPHLGRSERPLALVVDATEVGPIGLAKIVRQLVSYVKPASAASSSASPDERVAVMLLTPAQASSAALASVPRIQPLRWTTESIKSWPDCPATNAAERAALIAASGGWTGHVEKIIAAVEQGTPLADALKKWTEDVSDPAMAREHLKQADVNEHALESLRGWTECADGPEADAEMVRVLDEIGDGLIRLRELEDLGLLDRGPSGTSLDPATDRAIRRLESAR